MSVNKPNMLIELESLPEPKGHAGVESFANLASFAVLNTSQHQADPSYTLRKQAAEVENNGQNASRLS